MPPVLPRRTALFWAPLLVAGCGDSGTDPLDEGDPAPSDTAASPGVVGVVVGAPEVVVDYSAHACEAEDLPDVYAHAIRLEDGSLVLGSGNAPRNYFSFGPSFDALARSCRPVLVSADRPDAASFRNQEWITSLYREGGVIHALVHNEYHDPVATNCRPGDTSPANPCWYNAITYARSTDGGRSFQLPEAPGHVVAALPYPWDPASPRGPPPVQGYFEPSNMVRGPDGAFYVLFFAIVREGERMARGSCLMRTETLSDPSGWRGWDGEAFTLRMGSPYAEGASSGRACAFVSPSEIGDLRGSLTWNHYLGRYLLVGTSVRPGAGGALTCGFWFSLSRDLIRWTPAQLIREVELPFPPCLRDGSPHGSEIYPSLIDHGDTTPSFERTGRAPHLYWVIWNRGLDRDLLRAPLLLTLQPGAP